ncbi:RnfABCDGE type electron transport complex subunit D, partial [Salmonella enterica subsp. enterica serovar Montevideo]|nr:RnfABCDGE type electron transport complex subunit D [Salmonella enterica subsp. enterica serovar Montevideo]
GTGFAIIIAKQLYGGLGQNPFNPAMIGYVVLLISFPVQMTSWSPHVNLRKKRTINRCRTNQHTNTPYYHFFSDSFCLNYFRRAR